MSSGVIKKYVTIVMAHLGYVIRIERSSPLGGCSLYCDTAISRAVSGEN